MESAKVLATALLTMEGTPYIYQGDEIGMTNAGFAAIEDYKDIDTLNYYNEAIADGLAEADVMAAIHYRSRDNSRTPMQWNSQANGGFTAGKPWIAVNKNHEVVNVERQMENPHSILNFYRDLIRLRRSHPALIYGYFKTYDIEHEKVYCYSRTLDSAAYLILLNFSESDLAYRLPENVLGDQPTLLLGNYQEVPTLAASGEVVLRPYESRIYVS